MSNETTAGHEQDRKIEEAVRKLFEEQINPALQSHGGFAKLVKVENRNVYVELGGGCRGCPGARMTMRSGIEAYVREVAPEVDEVLDITDHHA